MKHLYSSFLIFICCNLSAQTFTTDPAFPVADQPLTLEVNATGTSLEGYTGDVWIWAWLPDCSADCDAPTNVNPATSAQDAAKVIRSGTDPNVYNITFTPATFFNKSAEEITRVGFKLKSVDWDDNRQTDTNQFITIFSGELQVSFSSPFASFVFVDPGGTIDIAAVASAPSQLVLFIDNSQVAVEPSDDQLSYQHTVVESGIIVVRIEAEAGGQTATDEFVFIVRGTSPAAPRPSGIIEGINYPADASQATFCLFAPGKSSIFLIGDFNDWLPSSTYQMAQDGDYFWITVNGLTPGTEYAFQYLVDEQILTGDPYADKILDPEQDESIDAATYPDLKPYPDSEIPEGWVSVMQTGQVPFQWSVNDFVAPPKEELVIYELLVRDFDEGHNYEAVIDRLDYLEDLGVNAIQLMPVMEFDGNLSWGYNPAYFFAPDKYYGTKDALKTFVDECHARGMAVILDMVLNHTHERNPIAQLYWDQADLRPAADNPWLNQQATHPFNVFFDFNHESAATRHFVDTVNYYWLEEYRFDGYRFDLSKGFTQTFSGDNIGLWNQYDQSRVDNLTRMTDKIWEHHPDAYVILEHLSDNDEEKVLADYGMMLWGNMNHNFNQLTMGFGNDSNIDWAWYGTRNWNDPHLISYMESHDEERLVYRNLTLGNTSNGGHNTRNLEVALERVKAASAVYYAIPGPRMLWQFGELGYDISIDQNGRTGNKPIPWASANDLNYDTDQNRIRLNKVTSELIRLKTSYDVFNTTDFTLDESQELVKQITLRNTPYTPEPSGTDEMNVAVVANFNVTTTTVETAFPHAGTWYSYFTQDELVVSGDTEALDLQPGEFRIYTDVSLTATETELISYVVPQAPELLDLSEVNYTGVQIDWSDNSIVESTYKVLRSANGGAFEEIASLNRNTTTYTDETAEANQNYVYKVVASNPSGTAESNTLEIMTTNVITSVNGSTIPGFHMYPNPTTGWLRIDGVTTQYDLTVLDLSGKLLLERRDLSGIYEADLSGWEKGIYLVVLQHSQGRHVLRLIRH